VEVVIFSISTRSVSEVSSPCGISDSCSPESERDGVGAMPRISAMCAADLDEMFLAFIARALWLNMI
jgi:hypothetical protein